jgi:hypothetical protein
MTRPADPVAVQRDEALATARAALELAAEYATAISRFVKDTRAAAFLNLHPDLHDLLLSPEKE